MDPASLIIKARIQVTSYECFIIRSYAFYCFEILLLRLELVANYTVLSALTIHHSPPIMGAIRLDVVYLVNYCSKWKFNLI